jgi:lipopolysaccharide export system permease protein
MRTLDRYLLRSFFYNYVLSLSVLVSLYVVLDLFLNFDEFTEGNKSVNKLLWDVGGYYIYNIPLYFSQVSGVITLFAACLTIARLQRQNEVTAVLASGTSLYRLVAPVVLAGLAMNTLLALDQEVLLPSVAPKLARTRDDVEGMRVYEVWFVRDGQDRLVSALQFSPAQKKIRGMIVMELDATAEKKGQLREVITADRAEWDEAQHGWNLSRGVRLQMVSDEEGGLSGEHSMKRIPVKFYGTELTPDELKLRQTAQWLQYLSVRQLNQLEKRGDVSPMQIAQIRHTRFTMPINNMILLLLGLSFFMTRLPTSVLTQGGWAVATCSIAFLLSFIGQQLVGTGDFSPALPAWLPIFLFGPLAVVLLENVKT